MASDEAYFLIGVFIKKCETVRSRCIKCYWDGSKSAYIEASNNSMNPWEEIKLEDYEKHMSLDSVRQLQAMNKIMHEQFKAHGLSVENQRPLR